MKLIVDSNILFAAIIKEPTVRKIIMHKPYEFLTVKFSEEEISKYKEEILGKSKLSNDEFDAIFDKLKQKLKMLDDQIIILKFEEAYEIMKNIDPKDSIFLAAALATNSDIWSDDQHFQKQNKIKIWKTEDLIKLV